MAQVQVVVSTVMVGVGATAVMDLWLVLLMKTGVQTQGFGMIGRWVGHLAKGKVAHQAISMAPEIKGELAIGWATHYAVGIGFASVLVTIAGSEWLLAPTVMPAIAFGIASVAAPLFVMQPAMGSGFAASKAPKPLWSVLRSFANHTVFGLGLWLSAHALAGLMA